MRTGWNLDDSYSNLPGVFYRKVRPERAPAPGLVVLNRRLAESLGLDPEALDSEQGAAVLSGNHLPDGAEPIAQAYAGHQFGHFTMLGDGRALLLGEQITPAGQRFDIQFKGSGQTPYSRRGDGRAALGPMLREYLISEAMHALGIPTTRSLAVVTTGAAVYRERPLPGAVLTRVAASHIRVGTFEFAAAIDDPAQLRMLADYTIDRHYPAAKEANNPYLALLESVMDRQAALVAQWMSIGFIHGVMNTDNMAIAGETIDYGPCAFMDHYHPATVFSSIDQQGRYAYANQPDIAQWNLARFAETLLPLIAETTEAAIEIAETAIRSFPGRYREHWLNRMRSKIGLINAEPDDAALIEGLLSAMQLEQLDFTNTFVALAGEDAKPAGLEAWTRRWEVRLQRQDGGITAARTLMQATNPAVIPRNLQVEAALEAAVENNDTGPLHALLAVLSRPFETPAETQFTTPAPAGQRYQTFCGT